MGIIKNLGLHNNSVDSNAYTNLLSFGAMMWKRVFMKKERSRKRRGIQIKLENSFKYLGALRKDIKAIMVSDDELA